ALSGPYLEGGPDGVPHGGPAVGQRPAGGPEGGVQSGGEAAPRRPPPPYRLCPRAGTAPAGRLTTGASVDALAQPATCNPRNRTPMSNRRRSAALVRLHRRL